MVSQKHAQGHANIVARVLMCCGPRIFHVDCTAKLLFSTTPDTDANGSVSQMSDSLAIHAAF